MLHIIIAQSDYLTANQKGDRMVRSIAVRIGLSVIQRYSYRYRLTTQRFGNAVAITTNLDIAVPGHVADVEVTGIEVRIQ